MRAILPLASPRLRLVHARRRRSGSHFGLPPPILLLALLAIASLPVASAAREAPVAVDPHAEVGGDCGTCVEADLGASQTYPGCYDCPDLWVHAGVETDGKHATVDAVACRGGFVVVCVVDERVVV